MGSRPLGDEELVELAREGDIKAYEELVRRHRHAAVRTAYVLLGAAEAEDAAQEAFVKAYRALDRFERGPPSVRGCCGSRRTRRRTGCAREGGARPWRSASGPATSSEMRLHLPRGRRSSSRTASPSSALSTG